MRTDQIVRSGNRVGIYYAEGGASQRGSAVTYDRAGSSIAEMKPDAVDWAKTMKGADWLHVTGITPALGANGAEGTRRACAAARAAGARVSVDLNFRKKLWTEAQAQQVMGPLMRDVDIVIANEEDLQSVLGVHVPGTDVTSGQLDVGGLPSGRRAGDPRFRSEDGRDHAARKPLRQRQRLERGALGRHDRDDAPQPALRHPAGRPHRRRRQLRGRADLRTGRPAAAPRTRFASPSRRARSSRRSPATSTGSRSTKSTGSSRATRRGRVQR